MKRCCKCKRKKDAIHFGANRRSKAGDGLHPECKKCVKKRKAIFYRKNKKSVNESGRIYKNKKRKSDLNYRLRDNLRARLRGAIKNNQKSGSAVQDLGCSIDFLKVYLENKFVEGMSWSNYGNRRGQWSIDHMIPLSKLDLADRQQLLKACHFSNLQPLWHVDNVTKSNS